MKNSDMRITRWPYLTAGVAMMLFVGLIYAWSILKAPLTTEFGWNDAELGLNFTITMSGFCVGGVLGGIIIKRVLPQILEIIAAALIFVGFFGSSRLTGDIAQLYVFYGVFAGLGIGITYNIVIATVTNWFPDKRATASGALLMGVGTSTLIFGPLMNWVIDTIGWRDAYFLLGVVIAAVLVVGSFFLKPTDERVNAIETGGEKKTSEVGEDFTVREIVKKSSFWKFYCIQILIAAIGTGVVSMARDVSISVGTPVPLAVFLVGLLSVCNGFGRIFFGFLFDTIGRRKTMILSYLIAILACVVMLVAMVLSSSVCTVIGFVLVGLAYGAMPPICSGLASSFYGIKNFALNFSVMNTMLIPASFAATISGVIIGKTGSYIPVFIMMLGLAIVAFCLNLSLKKA